MLVDGISDKFVDCVQKNSKVGVILPKIPNNDMAMGEAILAPGDLTEVQLLNSHSTSSFVSSILRDLCKLCSSIIKSFYFRFLMTKFRW